jgi:2-keto-4-pentenoate hydratase/2-oxohepta-3-ene-1,7-dioic acid hydratase in catechol pathway
MKIVRINHRGCDVYGVLEGDSIRLLTNIHYMEEPSFNGEQIPLAGTKLLSPCQPSKVVCIGLNYKTHAAEVHMALPEEPLLFLKPPTTVIGPDAGIELPAKIGQVDYEAELAVVVGRQARNISEADASGIILGYTCANDISARHLQKKDGQWTRAKSFDTFLPLGPWIETEIDPHDLGITLQQNGQLRQQSRTSDLIFPIPTLVSFVSKVMTLLPGDVIITGTPSGIGPLAIGDKVEVTIEGIGTLTNYVREGQ